MSHPPKAHNSASLTAWTSPASLIKIIAILALPVTASNILHALVGFVDTRMVSPLGAQALDAIGVGRTSVWMLMGVFMGLGVGITAYVARFTGAEEHSKARAYSTIGIITGGVIGVALMLVGLLIGEKPVQQMVTSESATVVTAAMQLTRQYAWDYLRILLIGLGGLGVQFSVVSIFNSLGRTIFPMWLLVLTNAANFVGNWYLIPRYEVAGCAWSTTLTTALVGAVGVIILARNGALCWNGEMLVRPWRKAWEMIKLGFPVTIQVVLRAMAMLTIFKLITSLPDFRAGYQSALHVGIQAESLAFMPALAFSTAAATLVGQNIGARKIEQARTSAMYCMYGSQVIMLTMGIMFFLFPVWFITLFIGNNAPEVVAPAASFLKIMAYCLPGLGISMTMMGVLRGSGDTQITAWITIAAMWFLRIPLAIIMSHEIVPFIGIKGLGMGLDGIWWAMTITVYAEATMAYLRFQSGRWTKIRLAEA